MVEPPLLERDLAPVQRSSWTTDGQLWLRLGVKVAAGESGPTVVQFDPAVPLPSKVAFAVRPSSEAAICSATAFASASEQAIGHQKVTLCRRNVVDLTTNEWT